MKASKLQWSHGLGLGALLHIQAGGPRSLFISLTIEEGGGGGGGGGGFPFGIRDGCKEIPTGQVLSIKSAR
uniref:Uncharacterized protein n=1 Tax=Echinococcus granulosus TaxID=6210 RepID=A0A068X3U3_ECHGR|nr:hypothetical protein EgrG_000935100 [Echinococcus granulosus]